MIYVDGGATLRAHMPARGRLLDVGCGTGKTASRYRVGLEGVDLYGIDGYHDPGEVADFIKFTKGNVDGVPLPYETGTFDAVLLNHILEHLRDPVGLVVESARVLKPGGIVYVETPSTRSLFVPDIAFMREQYSSANYFDDYTHLGRPQTLHSLHHLLARNGFEVVQLGYARPGNWIVAGARHVLSGLRHKNRYALCTGIWYLVGWAVYAIGRRVVAVKPESHV